MLIFHLAIQQSADGPAISNILAKAQASAQAISDQQNSSPSPTTILKSVNSSGYYMCSQPTSQQKNIEMPSPTFIYNEQRNPNISSQQHLQNMTQHRNNLNIFLQPDNSNTFECDESDENSSQHHQRQTQFTHQFHNNNFSYSQNETTTFLNDTQQEADQHTIQLRMNNLGNEDIV